MSPTTSDNPRVKRPYQPSITTFFYRSQASDPSYPSSGQRPSNLQRQSNSPSLPDNVQSDLLSVGMRVRKAVPEGYLTHKGLGMGTGIGAYTPSVGSDKENNILDGDDDVVMDRRSMTRESTPRELTPFCGLNKIGGFGYQDASLTSSAFLPADDAFFNPFSSQESHLTDFSTDSMPARHPLGANGKNKRTLDAYADDDGNEESFFEDDDDIGDFAPSCGSAVPRTMARPRTRRTMAAERCQQGMVYGGHDQESNWEEEAGFLVEPMDLER